MASQRDVQRLRSAQAGPLMRLYRESFAPRGGGRGLTQEELLRRMAEVDDEYLTRYSHGTVSRWESGATRPTLARLRVFGAALNLSETEVAGLILLSGLAPDFEAAVHAASTGAVPSRQVESAGVGSGVEPGAVSAKDESGGPESGEPDQKDSPAGSAGYRGAGGPVPGLLAEVRFLFLRVLLLGLAFSAFGYLLSLPGWDASLHTVPFAGFAMALVLAQGFLFPDRQAGLREFFWVSIFVVLTTPLLQFAPLGLDHYNFHVLDGINGTWVPSLLVLLVNLALASGAGLLFHLLQRWQYRGGGNGGGLVRAQRVVLPPSALVFVASAVITNYSVTLQLAFVVSVIAIVFTSLLVLRDPDVTTGERDRRLIFPVVAWAAMLCGTVGLAVILAIYVSPDLPMVLPDHNLLFSWEIDFAEMGFTREEALDRLNVGYMWHAMCLYAYMAFVVGGSLIIAVYRMGDGGAPEGEPASAGLAPGASSRRGGTGAGGLRSGFLPGPARMWAHWRTRT